MWNRSELKTKAKSVLKSTYWKSLLVSVIIAFAGGTGSRSSSSYNAGNMSGNDFNVNGYIVNQDTFNYIMTIAGGILLIVAIVAIALRLFIGYPLEIGGRKFFIQGAKEDADLNYLGYGFKKEGYLNIVKTMFLRGLYNFFWSLLFIIPGIIKYYAYSMVPYILAENPQMESDRAIELSMDMTKGHKLDIWVLELSFIGWYFLGALLFFVGTIFVWPYENATKAELYLVLRQNAIKTGLCSAYELSDN
ncbi:DUF975 family protein [Alkalibaculum sp. M08DMB]|uniref:DUF975 family protein n=2 Tax=Alkalibaculum sporogenes TaxID=2655001 RepID=A0A6A7KAW5_9FIRM|nr:DUF975 family protein [Alkalibaculum sporogenes]